MNKSSKPLYLDFHQWLRRMIQNITFDRGTFVKDCCFFFNFWELINFVIVQFLDYLLHFFTCLELRIWSIYSMATAICCEEIKYAGFLLFSTKKYEFCNFSCPVLYSLLTFHFCEFTFRLNITLQNLEKFRSVLSKHITIYLFLMFYMYFLKSELYLFSFILMHFVMFIIWNLWKKLTVSKLM